MVEGACTLITEHDKVHFCSVPGCSNHSERETSKSYFRLPLRRKKLLKIWMHKIGRKNLPINYSTRVCSAVATIL